MESLRIPTRRHGLACPGRDPPFSQAPSINLNRRFHGATHLKARNRTLQFFFQIVVALYFKNIYAKEEGRDAFVYIDMHGPTFVL